MANNKENEEDELIKLIHESFPSKTLVEIMDFENEDHQSYKYLYENLRSEYEQHKLQLDDLQSERQSLESKLKDAADELAALKEIRDDIEGTSEKTVSFIEDFLQRDIVISNMCVLDESGNEVVTRSDETQRDPSVSDRPGVYGFKRPSWFTPLKKELTKENISKSNAGVFEQVFREKKAFWKNIWMQRKKGESIEKIASTVDEHRKQQITSLLQDRKSSNSEKYLKYILLTPGLSKDYLKTLTGASELGLDANCVIELLEQPEECFNKEIIEIFVSETHKASEYNMKRELADELLQGKWFVSAEINGELKKFQLTPYEWLEEIYKKFNDICCVLKNSQKTEEEFSVEYDDSMISPVLFYEDDPE